MSALQQPEVSWNAAVVTPSARRAVLSGFRAAVLESYGDAGLAAVSRHLPIEVRRDTIDAFIIARPYVPETYTMAWIDAIWYTVAERHVRVFATMIDRSVDHCFGRVHRTLLQKSTPPHIGAEAARLWRGDHNTGTLSCEARGQTLVFTLRDHPYVETALSRAAVAERIRYSVSLSRCERVTVTQHRPSPYELAVHATWR